MRRSWLPPLGPRGEGWLIGQIVFFVAIASAPGAAWAEPVGTIGLWSGALMLFGGLGLAAWAIFELGPNLTPFPRPRRAGVLVEHGIYRVIRHPVYAGLVLITMGWSLMHGSVVGLVVAIAFAAFLDLKARREEELLVAAFPGYEAYRRRTKRFIPGLY